MKVEIWSDVMCPFCYIGKRKFEKALEFYRKREDVEIEWKSFQLDPNMKTDPSKSINQMLAEKKGISFEEAKEMNDYVTNMAKDVGLMYNFDKAIVANSFDAHRFAHYAKTHNLGDQAEERLFKAYFTEGKNTADINTLLDIGSEIGLDREQLSKVLNSNEYSYNVKTDISEAQELGIRGVPFFVFDRKYAVSGAQPTEVFLKTMEKIIEEKN